MKPAITREQYRKSLKYLVCSHCGSSLDIIGESGNRDFPIYWSGCSSCQIFDHGVNKEIYDVAKTLVDMGYQIYSHLQPNRKDDSDTKIQKEQYRISAACELVKKVLDYAG